MHSFVLKIPSGHLKYRIEQNYLLEKDLAYKNFTLCLILLTVSLQLNVSQLYIEEAYYDNMFRNYVHSGIDLRSLLVQFGIPEPDVVTAHLEFITDFINRYFNPRMKNFFSVTYDSGYQLTITLKQTK